LLPKFRKYANDGMWHAEHCEYFRIRAIALTIITSMGSRSTESEKRLFFTSEAEAKDLSPQTVNNYRAVIAAFFGYAVRRELVEKNPVMAIEKTKVIDTAPEIFTPEQLAQLLNAAPAELLPALAIQAFAGLRTAELLRLEWRDIF
jgi:integrase